MRPYASPPGGRVRNGYTAPGARRIGAWLLDLASERVLDNANTPDEHDGAHAALQSQRRS